MKIASSEIAMASSHAKMEKDVSNESLKMWDANKSVEMNRTSESLKTEESTDGAYAVMFSDNAKNLADTMKEAKEKWKTGDSSEGVEEKRSIFNGEGLPNIDDMKFKILEEMLSRLTGKRIKSRGNGEGASDEKESGVDRMWKKFVDSKTGDASTGSGGGQPVAQASQGWGVSYDSFQSHHEKEAVTFKSAGTVKLEDGREINFSLDLSMKREFYEENKVSVRAGDALKDPLVLNFSSATVGLSQEKMQFDIDSDGQADSISKLKAGSAYLALDKNGDGTINNGKELFGAETGDGFAELAQYDNDKNGWIDENDPVFASLKLWTQNEKGEDVLIGLKEGNVGAIALQNVSTEFSLKDAENDTMGQLRQTGVFLKENGGVGTIQKVDLAI